MSLRARRGRAAAACRPTRAFECARRLTATALFSPSLLTSLTTLPPAESATPMATGLAFASPSSPRASARPLLPHRRLRPRPRRRRRLRPPPPPRLRRSLSARISASPLARRPRRRRRRRPRKPPRSRGWAISSPAFPPPRRRQRRRRRSRVRALRRRASRSPASSAAQCRRRSRSQRPCDPQCVAGARGVRRARAIPRRSATHPSRPPLPTTLPPPRASLPSRPLSTPSPPRAPRSRRKGENPLRLRRLRSPGSLAVVRMRMLPLRPLFSTPTPSRRSIGTTP